MSNELARDTGRTLYYTDQEGEVVAASDDEDDERVCGGGGVGSGGTQVLAAMA